MSMSTTIVYGYGVDKETLRKVSIKALVEFMKKHVPDWHETMMNYLPANPTEADYEGWFDEYECNNTGIRGKYSFLSIIMSGETGIRFEYHCSSENNEEAIIMPRMMPWECNNVERVCTEDIIDYIFKNYFAELGVEVTPTEISVEYYG